MRTRARRAVVAAIAQVLKFSRGRYRQDGRVTLLSVDYNLTDHVLRLASTFRAHVDPGGAVVVVQNGGRGNNRELRRAGIKVAGWGLNIGHGPALDWGLRHVGTQYVLICDPDAVVVSEDFRRQLMQRLDRYGVAGIVISDQPDHQRYHPICLAFDVGIWKRGRWSMVMGNWTDKDVGWEVTARTGGLNPAAVLPLTRGGWNGSVWAESFSNTYGLARIRGFEDGETIDGYPVEHVRRYHQRWIEWADRVAAGAADVDGFPQPERLHQ